MPQPSKTPSMHPACPNLPAALESGVVGIWMQELDEPGEPVEAFQRVLSRDEQQRAARFHKPRDGQRFAVARGFLRRTLSRIVGDAPEAIRFRYAAQGKPSLATESDDDHPVQFNLAHSDHVAILAVTAHDPIGVDIERIRPVRSRDGIVAKHFSPVEREAFARFAEPDRPAAFFRVWTRKEAIVKAIGSGLAISLTSFDVSLDEQTRDGLLAMRHPDHATGRWSLISLDAPDGFVAALAVSRRGPIGVVRA